MEFKPIEEQIEVLKNDKKNMLVSASAGSGKTFIMIKYITQLVKDKRVPINEIVVLTFTKAAANEMKERLLKSLKGITLDKFVVDQIDSLPTANISTIDAFCEKMLKKYANLVGLKDTFQVADENYSQKIKYSAFENAFKIFEQTNIDNYLTLMDFYKNDKNKIRSIIFEIENLVQSISDRNDYFDKNLRSDSVFFEKSAQFYFNFVKNTIKKSLFEIEKLNILDYQNKLEDSLKDVLGAKDVFEIANACERVSLPRKPFTKIIGEVASNLIDVYKEKISNSIKGVCDLNLTDKANVEFQKNSVLEKAILKLFLQYQDSEDELKKAENVLDFADLERYMAILSEKQNLFEGFKYVFIDEYQDTNKIQEKIVKNIAKNGNFVAVGDAKQGIYGFRLASCEIFLNDVKEFSSESDSTVKYLKSNFRSDKKILDFVNSVFKVVMTDETCGIDYQTTSMLESKLEFKSNEKNVVCIDFVKEDEKTDKKEGFYSVRNSQSSQGNDFLKEILDIKARIFEVMKTKIFDDGKFRDCQYSDIAILSRSRGELFRNLETILQESGIPVNSNSKENLLDEVEIKVLVNLLKLARNIDDDIALLSVLLSPFGGFTLEEIALEKDERNLCEIVLSEKKFEKFVRKIEDLRKNIFIFGVRRSLSLLFDACDYHSYINMKRQGGQISGAVSKFLSTITESGFDFDVCGLINFFETVDISLASEPVESFDAINLMTIHASKGLEYPVVFLIGCDQSFKDKPVSDGSVKIDDVFGLALKYYDTEQNQSFESLKMRAISLASKQKEFAEELMIFYVALTRAKNKLYMFGRYNDKMFERNDVSQCLSYFDLISFALGVDKEKLISEGIERNFVEMNFIEDVEQKKIGVEQTFDNPQYDEKDLQKLLSYLNFKYRMGDEINFKLKESVTSLNQKDQENELARFSNENFTFGGAGVEIGNAYHLALEILDFSKIENEEDLKKQISENEIFGDINDLLDKKILFKNIMILKELCADGKVFKEKSFMIKDKICNMIDSPLEDEILVQGVVDLFVIKNDEIVLVDYKYSNSTNDNYLISKYKAQLKLYKNALENGFGIEVKNSYLLSLKNSKLIRVNL